MLPDFTGNAAWVHAQEGHAGTAYWPGGASGVTLDPGFDLGSGPWSLFERHYGPLLTPAQVAACRAVRGLSGAQAKAALARAPALRSIRLSRAQADALFPVVAAPFWAAITTRFPNLKSAPGEVQTAMLSLAYNRGAWNKGLAVLSGPIARRQWYAVARAIHGMQQSHPLPGIRRRRRAEARLIDPTLPS